MRFTSGENNISEAVNIAQLSGMAVVFGSGSEAKGRDRENLDLSRNQNQLITDVAAANENTIVVLNTGGPVVMPWADDVATILEISTCEWKTGMLP